MSVDNLYRILGVDMGADQSEIRKAFSEKMFKLHPDKGGEGGSEMYRVMKAYEILKDPVKRSYYDLAFIKSEADRKKSFNNKDGYQTHKDTALNYGMTFFLTPEEMFRGMNVVVNYKNREFLIQIPKESYSGRFLRYLTEHEGQPLSIEIKIEYKKGREKHVKDNGDVYMEHTIDSNTAAFGGKEMLVSPLGENISVFLKNGIRDSQIIRLKGQGMMTRTGKRGDLYLSIKIKKVIFSLKAVFS